jgi:hypothetical protein
MQNSFVQKTWKCKNNNERKTRKSEGWRENEQVLSELVNCGVMHVITNYSLNLSKVESWYFWVHGYLFIPTSNLMCITFKFMTRVKKKTRGIQLVSNCRFVVRVEKVNTVANAAQICWCLRMTTATTECEMINDTRSTTGHVRSS